ncbi:MAG: DsbA family protein [Sandaracinaceae bacterium]
MSKGSAIISIMIAFVSGLIIGTFLTSQGGGGTSAEITEEGNVDTSAANVDLDEDVERTRIEVTDSMPQKGPDDALVTIVEFSDFQCPFCSRVIPTVSRLVNEYEGKVRVVWRDNPLPMHAQAVPAAEAAREAYAQGGDDKFWAMHDLLFENQRQLGDEDLRRYAEQLGLDMTRFNRAMEEHTHRETVQQDQQAASSVGASGTPYFFINGRELRGAQPFERFQAIVDEEIATAERLVEEEGVARSRLYATFMRNAATGRQPSGGDRPAAAARGGRPQPDPTAVYRVPVGDSPVKGNRNALVTIIEFSEFQCPFCNRVQPTLAQIEERYGDDVRIVFKHNPLPFHPNAMPAAEAAMEVLSQRGPEAFWRFHDLAFENQSELNPDNLERWAQEVGVNMSQYRAAMEDHRHRSRIEEDQELARSLGASGTPSFFINGKNLRGAQPFTAFEAAINRELAAARERVAAGTSPRNLYDAIIADGATSPQFLEGAGAQPSAPAQPPPSQVYEIDVPRDAPARGPRNAPVTIQLFSDFQCPFCGRVRPTIEQVVERYGNQVRLVWRNYPLPMHPQAMPAAEAALEVHAQAGDDKFWAYHDLIFENQREINPENLERWAQELGGIDMARFRRAMEQHTHRARVQADMEAVREAGARIGTPSFFINGKLLQGAQPFPSFQAAIDEALEG